MKGKSSKRMNKLSTYVLG